MVIPKLTSVVIKEETATNTNARILEAPVIFMRQRRSF
jgi:hypothetical protein